MPLSLKETFWSNEANLNDQEGEFMPQVRAPSSNHFIFNNYLIISFWDTEVKINPPRYKLNLNPEKNGNLVAFSRNKNDYFCLITVNN